MSNEPGILYVVATPIGNLGDMSSRACEVLSGVTRVAAEDTRHSLPLLRHFDIRTPLLALHEHNEEQRSEYLLRLLQAGESIALISDAGTPLISDPGYRLLRLVREAGVTVVPVPGPSAVVAALSVSGLPTDRFVFEGFLPARTGARERRLQQLVAEPRTLVFYESSHRIVATLEDMVKVFGGERLALLARELTKLHEQTCYASLEEILVWIRAEPVRQKGEFVLLLHGAPEQDMERQEVDRILGLLMQELPVRQAAALAARITGVAKNQLYKQGLALKKDDEVE